PSYVLGGRAMEIVSSDAELDHYMRHAVRASPDHPVLIDEFLPHATEFDVDAVGDGTDVVIAGIMEHIEEAGVHSGDSSCSLPPVNVSRDVLDEIREVTRVLGRELGVIGLMNVQYALRGRRLYVLEVNPRGSRTVPFVCKATGIPFAKIAARVGAGETLAQLGARELVPDHVSVKIPVFPFRKFAGVDTILGPEMRSTGEVMGIGADFGTAFASAMVAEGTALPTSGRVFISVRDEDKKEIVVAAHKLVAEGLELVATGGTAEALRAAGLPCTAMNKTTEGRPNVVDALLNGEIAMVITTASNAADRAQSFVLRRTTLVQRVPYFTTVSGALAAAQAIATLRAEQRPPLLSLQELHVRPGFTPEDAPADRAGYR
ncbi:MAG: carbamoyl phosphate synthase large subunit, partial [Deltaproteobacteria bacterium]|nr:carbamoyl phosphate synthase large subunit [Nannocystaceae bacterium]